MEPLDRGTRPPMRLFSQTTKMHRVHKRHKMPESESLDPETEEWTEIAIRSRAQGVANSVFKQSRSLSSSELKGGWRWRPTASICRVIRKPRAAGGDKTYAPA